MTKLILFPKSYKKGIHVFLAKRLKKPYTKCIFTIIYCITVHTNEAWRGSAINEMSKRQMVRNRRTAWDPLSQWMSYGKRTMRFPYVTPEKRESDNDAMAKLYDAYVSG